MRWKSVHENKKEEWQVGKYNSENLKGIGSLKVEGRRNNTKTIYGVCLRMGSHV